MVEPHPEKVKLYFKMAQAPTGMVKPHSKTSKPHPKMVQPHTETDKSHQEIGKTQLVCNLSVFGLFLPLRAITLCETNNEKANFQIHISIC